MIRSTRRWRRGKKRKKWQNKHNGCHFARVVVACLDTYTYERAVKGLLGLTLVVGTRQGSKPRGQTAVKRTGSKVTHTKPSFNDVWVSVETSRP